VIAFVAWLWPNDKNVISTFSHRTNTANQRANLSKYIPLAANSSPLMKTRLVTKCFNKKSFLFEIYKKENKNHKKSIYKKNI
jgi:hypothetical protein